MHRALTVLLFFIFTTGIIVIGVAMKVGDELSRPAHRSIGSVPADLPAESIVLHSVAGKVNGSIQSISGWFARGIPGKGVVLLLHGVRSDRRQMLGRARFLFQAGYSVMLIDLPGHGESSGDRITAGYREAEGVDAALNYLATTFSDEKVAVIGASLGAAAFVLSQASPSPSAVVLESMYATIEAAITHRLRQWIGPPSGLFTPLFLWQLPFRLDISAAELRPIDKLPSLSSPVLIMSGREDQHTPLPETLSLFEVANQPKELWIVAGAAHVDLHAYNPAAYEARIAAFLCKHLHGAVHPVAPPGKRSCPDIPCNPGLCIQ